MLPVVAAVQVCSYTAVQAYYCSSQHAFCMVVKHVQVPFLCFLLFISCCFARCFVLAHHQSGPHFARPHGILSALLFSKHTSQFANTAKNTRSQGTHYPYSFFHGCDRYFKQCCLPQVACCADASYICCMVCLQTAAFALTRSVWPCTI